MATFPALKAKVVGEQGQDIQKVIDVVQKVLATVAADPGGALPHPDTANALRAIIGSGADSPLVGQAKSILNPADNYGGRMAFRRVAPLAIILVIIFGILYGTDRARGGYQAEQIGPAGPAEG